MWPSPERQNGFQGREWFAGLTCDHLYADCPNRTRAEKTLREFGDWDIGGTGIDPHGTDVCGLCVHRYDRTNR